MPPEPRTARSPVRKRVTLVTGHYGCGKTNLAINLALDLSASHDDVALVDLDVVNPYFRSSDYTQLLTARGIRVVAPLFAGTTLDVPHLSGAIAAALRGDGHVIVDAGGDDAGATALGAYAGDLAAVDYDMFYVINRYRNLTATPAAAAAVLREIESASHLRATGVVNNSHLQRSTTLDTVRDALAYARETASLLGLPLVCTAVPRRYAGGGPGSAAAAGIENAYPVDIYVRTPWDETPGDGEEVNEACH